MGCKGRGKDKGGNKGIGGWRNGGMGEKEARRKRDIGRTKEERLNSARAAQSNSNHFASLRSQ